MQATTVAIPHQGIWAEARQVIRTLQDAGYETYIAGGAVRDMLLGRPVTDVDVATAARPDVVEQLFPRTINVGKSFGVIIVPTTDGGQVEVATFRSDECYIDGRRPTAVRFASAREDVERRDFTINALLVNPTDGLVQDHVGGLADIHARRLRAVGDAAARMREDRLRVLRGLRFAAHLDLTWEAMTWAAVVSTPVTGLSAERIWEEWRKALAPGGSAAVTWARYMVMSNHLAECFPTLAGCDAWPGLAALTVDDVACVRLAVWLGPGSLPETWLASQPLPRRVINDALWLLSCRRNHTWAADINAAPAQRLLRCEPRMGLLIRFLQVSADQTPSHAIMVAYEKAIAQGPFQPWVRATDLQALGIAPGPILGRVLRAVEDAQLTGLVTDRVAALAYVKTIEK